MYFLGRLIPGRCEHQGAELCSMAGDGQRSDTWAPGLEKWKSHVKREFPARACGKTLPMSKAAGQPGSVHLHLGLVQLLRAFIAHNYSKIFEQPTSQILVWICEVGIRFMDFVFAFCFCFSAMQLHLLSCKSLLQITDIQSKRTVFISASGAHRKWLVFCRTFAGNLLYCFITSMEHLSALPLSQSLQGLLWQRKTSKRMLKLQQSKPKKTGKFFVSYRTGSVFTDQQCLWKVKFKFDKASFIIILI